MPTRIEVEVGASYLSTPGDVKAGDPRGDRQRAAGAEVAGAGRAAACLRRLRDHLSRAVLDRHLRGGRDRARRGADGDLLQLQPPRHRDPVADRGRLSARVAGAGRGDQAAPARGDARRGSICSRGCPTSSGASSRSRPRSRIFGERRADRPAGRGRQLDVRGLRRAASTSCSSRSDSGSRGSTPAATSARCRCCRATPRTATVLARRRHDRPRARRGRLPPARRGRSAGRRADRHGAR